jgi:hypothetical protein
MKFLPRVCDPSLFSRLPGTQFPVSMVHSDYVIKFVSDLRQVGGFLRGSSGFLRQ